MDLLLSGLMTGLSVAVPVGPNGALCIRRSLAVGRSAGFATGFGAATAHAFYVAIAIGGLGVSQFALNGTAFVRPAGLALIVLGLRTWRAEPPSEGGSIVGDTTG